MAACAQTGPDASTKTMPDNHDNRLTVAKHFLDIMLPKEMLQGIATRLVKSVPEKNRKVFLEVMSSKEIEQVAYRINLNSLAKHFTVGELNAMVAFYGSPEGQSAYKKFGPFMAEVMPQLQQEVKKAIIVVQKQQDAQTPESKDQITSRMRPSSFTPS